MFLGLTDQPYQYMTVEHHIFKVEFFLIFVLMNEGRFKLAFFLEVELFHLDLLCEIYTVLRHSLENRFLRAPVDCELLVLLVVVKVVDFIF